MILKKHNFGEQWHILKPIAWIFTGISYLDQRVEGKEWQR
jgi:hypothetical protein